MAYIQESWGTDIVSALTAAFVGYGTATLAKAGMPGTALVVDGVLGVGGVVTKHLTDRPYLHELLEAVGYGGFAGLGYWAAEATTTLGGKGPGAAPFWQPGAKSGLVRRGLVGSAAGLRPGDLAGQAQAQQPEQQPVRRRGGGLFGGI